MSTIGWSITILLRVLLAFETTPTRSAYGLGATVLVLYAPLTAG